MNLCLVKHSIFLSCNIIYVASSHSCAFDHFLKKNPKTSKLYFPLHTSILQPQVVNRCTVQACVQRRGSPYLMMMIQQKDETLQVFAKHAHLVKNKIKQKFTFQKTKQTVCPKLLNESKPPSVCLHVLCCINSRTQVTQCVTVG